MPYSWQGRCMRAGGHQEAVPDHRGNLGGGRACTSGALLLAFLSISSFFSFPPLNDAGISQHQHDEVQALWASTHVPAPRGEIWSTRQIGEIRVSNGETYKLEVPQCDAGGA